MSNWHSQLQSVSFQGWLQSNCVYRVRVGLLFALEQVSENLSNRNGPLCQFHMHTTWSLTLHIVSLTNLPSTHTYQHHLHWKEQGLLLLHFQQHWICQWPSRIHPLLPENHKQQKNHWWTLSRNLFLRTRMDLSQVWWRLWTFKGWVQVRIMSRVLHHLLPSTGRQLSYEKGCHSWQYDKHYKYHHRLSRLSWLCLEAMLEELQLVHLFPSIIRWSALLQVSDWIKGWWCGKNWLSHLHSTGWNKGRVFRVLKLNSLSSKCNGQDQEISFPSFRSTIFTDKSILLRVHLESSASAEQSILWSIIRSGREHDHRKFHIKHCQIGFSRRLLPTKPRVRIISF